MKRILLFLLCVSTSLVLLAAPVTREQALEVAARFRSQQSHRAASQDAMQVKAVQSLLSRQGEPLLYAVNIGEQEGFVLVSGDDRMRPVLGYADQGTFDEASMPDNMRGWLEGYAEEMRWLDAQGYQPVLQRRADGNIKVAIPAMIQTQWNQGAPYYYYCPLDGTVYSVTGCAATAMAQVVYYNAMRSNMPKKLAADIPGYTTSTKKFVIAPIDAKSTTLEWSAMTATYNNEQTIGEASVQAVCTLMKCCGSALEMNYAASSSGASSEKLPMALKRYFGFDTTTRLIYRMNYSIAEWTDIIYNELKSGRPVLYTGHSSGGGHEFVIDGYDGAELFHVNWGWGGDCDGHFALTVLNPGDNSGIGASATTDGYSFGQDATIGIQYGSGESYAEPQRLSTYTLTASGTMITYQLYNVTSSTQTFEYGIGMKDAGGDIVLFQTTPGEKAGMKVGEGITASLIVPTDADKAGQTLKVFPVSRVKGTTAWLTDLSTEVTYVQIAYDGSGNPTLEAHPSGTLTQTSFNVVGDMCAKSTQKVTVGLKNTGDEFYGVLYFFASTTENKGSYLQRNGLTVVKGGVATATFDFIPTAPGTYTLWVATDSNGDNVVASKTEVGISAFNDTGVTGDFALTAFSINEADPDSWTKAGDGSITADVYSKTVTVSTKVTNISNDTRSARFGFILYKKDGESWVKKKTLTGTNTLTLNAGGSAQYNLGFGSYDTGEYRLELATVTGEKYTPVDTRYHFSIVDGYVANTATGGKRYVKVTGGELTIGADELAADLSTIDLSTISIAPNANPNTLYILGSSQTEPTSLSGKNVVKGGVAAQITLVDGNGFYSPIDFTAEKITYTRTFDKFYNEKGNKNWTTLVLPFAATTVENDQRTLPWDVEHRRIWLMQFSGETGPNIEFTTASTPLQANTPYIIALPGDEYDSFSLKGHATLTFKADDAEVKAHTQAATTGANYKFVGTMLPENGLDYVYLLNDDETGGGNNFVKTTENGSVGAFRSYFAPTSVMGREAKLFIVFGSEATAIQPALVERRTDGDDACYNLAGQRVTNPTKGLYIVNGKKVIIK